MHKSESDLENETHNILQDFEIKTDHLDFTIPADHRMKTKENQKRYKYLDLARELKKCCGTLE